MQLANQESQRFDHEYIGTEHLLLGLVKEGSGVAVRLLKNLNVDFREIVSQVEALIQSRSDPAAAGEAPKMPRAKKVIEYSLEEARNLSHDYVGSEHLLLGLLRERDGVAAKVLMNFGLQLDDARAQIALLLSQNREEFKHRFGRPEFPASGRGE
jgi:ATP-dependent Clp protease ATP-binding subunit ClpC